MLPYKGQNFLDDFHLKTTLQNQDISKNNVNEQISMKNFSPIYSSKKFLYLILNLIFTISYQFLIVTNKQYMQ